RLWSESAECRLRCTLNEFAFAPASMIATTLDPKGRGDLAPALGYTELGDDGKMTPGTRRLIDLAQGRGSAAGSGVPTAHDLLMFAESLRRHPLLSATVADHLLADEVEGQRPSEHYAMGFVTRRQPRNASSGTAADSPALMRRSICT